MLTSIDVESDNSFNIPILGATPKDSILVRQITGLNPPDLNLFIGDYARDGGIYQGRRVGNRNIVMTFELNPNPALGETVPGLREKLYKAFYDPLAEADYLKMNFNLDDDRVLYAVGYGERIETEIFSAETLMQISIICPDPYLRDNEATIHENSAGWTTVPFTYNGTASTGFEVEIKVGASTPKLILANNTVTNDTDSPLYPRGRMILNRAFAANDIITINTVRGHRRIWLTPGAGGPTVSLFADLTPTSPWLELHSQNNTMMVYGNTPSNLPAVITKLTHVTSYWGI